MTPAPAQLGILGDPGQFVDLFGQLYTYLPVESANMEKSLVRPRKGSPIVRRFLILIPMAILMVASVSAFADQNTFTKWVTRAPRMAGFVGGANGNGSYAGEILKYTEGTTTVIEALYYFDGAKLPFTALVHVKQTGMKAVISGVVTEGWMKGNQVEGQYTQITSKQSPDGTAFQGTLDIMRTVKARDHGY